jgi:hypothetical protein
MVGANDHGLLAWNDHPATSTPEMAAFPGRHVTVLGDHDGSRTPLFRPPDSPSCGRGVGTAKRRLTR